MTTKKKIKEVEVTKEKLEIIKNFLKTGEKTDNFWTFVGGLPETGQGMYPFVPYNKQSFLIMLDRAIATFKKYHGRKPRTFLDIGCGIGNILYYARQKGLKVSGLEFNPAYIPFAKKLLPKAEIIQGDMLKWVPAKGTTYDIIWSFIPLHGTGLWEKFSSRFMKYFPNNQVAMFPAPLRGLSLKSLKGISLINEEGIVIIKK